MSAVIEAHPTAASRKGRRRWTTIAAAAVIATATLIGGLLSAAPAHAALPAPKEQMVQRILSETNAIRAGVGLAPLALNPAISVVAENWSGRQAAAGVMSHNPNYAQQIPSGWQKAAENVAYGYRYTEVVTAWKNSPGHYKNMVGDYTDIGIGFAQTSDGTLYYTQNFGKYPGHTGGQPAAPSSVPFGQMVTDGSGLWVLDGTTRKIPVANSSVAIQYGSSAVATGVTSLSGYTAASSPLSLIAKCSSGYGLVASGRFWPISTAAASGFTATELSDASCGKLPRGSSYPAAIYVRTDYGTVYVLENGTRRAATSTAAMNQFNGGSTPSVIAPLSSASMGTIPLGKAITATNTLLRSSAADPIWFMDGDSRKIRIDSTAVAAQYGLSYVYAIDAGSLSGYATAPAPLSLIAQCSSGYGLVAGGRFWPVSTDAASGFTPTQLSDAACAALPRGSAFPGAIYVRPDYGTVYVLEDGTRRAATSTAAMVAHNGGTTPTVIVPLTSASAVSVPLGQAITATNTLLRAADAAGTWFMNGDDRKIRVDNTAVAAQYGLSYVYAIDGTSLAGYGTASAALSVVASCDSGRYLAAGGTLWRIPASDASGLPATSLDSAACSTLPQRSVGDSKLFFRTDYGTLYVIDGGQRRAVSSQAAMTRMNGGSAPSSIPVVPSSTVGSIPVGSAVS